MVVLKTIKIAFFIILCTFVSPVGASTDDALHDVNQESPVLSTIEEEYTSYTYWRGNLSEGRIAYETELLQLLLDISEDKFGKAKLDYFDEALSFPRGMVDIERGEHFHVLSGPYIRSRFNHEHIFLISQPILKNLLGYRRLIINKARYDEIRSINNIEELLALKAGLVQEWHDVSVFKHNNFTVEHAKVYKNLYKMLVRNRFDYLPLGAGEIEISLKHQGAIQDKLKIVDNIVLYYPWPVHFFVTKANPELADRLNYALEVVEKTKQLDQMFWRHYAELIESMNKATTTVYVLENHEMEKTNKNRLPYLLDKAKIIELAPL